MLQISYSPKSPACPFPVVSWDLETLTLSADASDIRWNGEREIQVTSTKTGRTETFVFVKEQHDREGDLMSRTFAGPRGLKFEVFND